MYICSMKAALGATTSCQRCATGRVLAYLSHRPSNDRDRYLEDTCLPANVLRLVHSFVKRRWLTMKAMWLYRFRHVAFLYWMRANTHQTTNQPTK